LGALAFFTGIAVLLLSCSLISGVQSPGAGTGGEATDVHGQIEGGDLVWEGAQASGEGTTGSIIEVRLSNPGDEDLRTVIPCGTVLIPGDSGEQVMMVVQSEPVTVPAGEEAAVSPFVVCIDSNAAVPGTGSSYTLGGLTEGDLLQLAQCVCEEDLEGGFDPLEGMGVQFAAWMTADGRTLTDSVREGAGEGGAMGEVLGEEFGEGLSDAIVELIGTMEQPAMEWLDRCHIELGP
jgi:hypothetical protein